MKQIEKRELANGIELVISDCSKKLAGDRWLVKLSCQASIPLTGWMMERLAGEEREVAGELGDALTYELVMERNFIDEQQIEEVMGELLARVESNLLVYMEREGFVCKLFENRLAEIKEELIIRREMPAPAEPEEDEPEPADFSDCFK